ncbi:hypothetical protein [Methylosinus sp. Ce-a6]|uniref:hypothetical protein n=1 Tax=Methylosinus sp. Ce-a6 TaxID=2172005 RepID=UPI001356DCB0|nr:hypothetical protein [Methylosinus sp. Ce-a6]
MGAYFVIAMSFVVLSALQTIYYGLPLIAPALGLRAYVLYAPLAFILGGCLQEAHIRRFIVVSLYISIPIALLVYVQFLSPPDAAINKGTSDEVEHVFVVVAGIVRPYGPFTFVQAQNTFAAMMVAVVIIAWDQRKRFSISPMLLAPAGFAIMTMGALSGGRTFFGSAALVGCAYILAGLTSKRVRTGIVRLASVIALAAGFLLVFVIVFPDSFEAMSERQATAEAAEGSTLGRALGAFAEGVETMASAPLFGYGIGAGNNGVLQFLGKSGFEFGETEGGHIINEMGPIFGALTLLARVAMTAWIGWRCILVNRLTGDGSALIMFGFSGYLLAYAQITLQNQLLSFCWLGMGVTLALCRSAMRHKAGLR